MKNRFSLNTTLKEAEVKLTKWLSPVTFFSTISESEKQILSKTKI